MCSYLNMEHLMQVLIFLLLSSFAATSYHSLSVTEKEYVLMPQVFGADDIDRCLLYGNDALYCKIHVQLRPKNSGNVSQTWRVIEKTISNPKYYRHDLLRRRVCVTEMLDKNPNILKNETEMALKLTSYYNNKYKDKGVLCDVTIKNCERMKPSYFENPYEILFLSVIAVYTCIIICATLLDLFVSKDLEGNDLMRKSYYGHLISSMSLKQNWSRLITVNLLDKDTRDLSCIQGVRVYSLFKIVLLHTSMATVVTFVSNTYTVEQDMSDPLQEVYVDPTYTIQCFFMISSWLVSYKFFDDMERQKDVTLNYIISLFIKRYLRFTPTLAFIVFFSSTWLVHSPQGVFWDMCIRDEIKTCSQNWWSSLLYINNFVDRANLCFWAGWFLTVNMQLHILSLFLLWIMWKYQQHIPWILGSALTGHFFYLFYMTYSNDYQYAYRIPGVEDLARMLDLKIYFDIYISGIANVSAVIAGLAYGYIFYKRQSHPLFKDKFSLTFWWRVAIGINLITWTLPLFITLDPKVNPITNAVFASLWRTFFNFSSGMIILGIIGGQGGILKRILEDKFVYILGRLSYSVYLTHTLLIRVRVGMRRSISYWNYYIIFLDYLSDISLGLLTALILTLFVELPMAEVCKNLMKKQTSKQTKVKKQE